MIDICLTYFRLYIITYARSTNVTKKLIHFSLPYFLPKIIINDMNIFHIFTSFLIGYLFGCFQTSYFISKKYKNIWYSIGIHPHNVSKKYSHINKTIESNINDKNFIGIGETGLDFYYQNSDIDLQKKSFINHINLSRDYDIPLIIHTRDADKETINILYSICK